MAKTPLSSWYGRTPVHCVNLSSSTSTLTHLQNRFAIASLRLASPVTRWFRLLSYRLRSLTSLSCVNRVFSHLLVHGAIPALQQVMVATRGATDIFSGVGRHVNTSLKKLGVQNVQAGIGCEVGIDHGFGVGIALKPGVVRGIQSSFEEARIGVWDDT